MHHLCTIQHVIISDNAEITALRIFDTLHSLRRARRYQAVSLPGMYALDTSCLYITLEA
jgi:hypothetical protein